MLIAGRFSVDNRLTFDGLRMTWVSIKGRFCFGGRFLAVARIVTIEEVIIYNKASLATAKPVFTIF